MDARWEQATKILKAGKVGVIPTDTIYGLVGSALNESVVDRVYRLKGRDFTKPCIILVSGVEDIDQFNIFSSKIEPANKYWPGPFSIVLPLSGSGLGKWRYLHRGKDSLAFRNPKHPSLSKLLKLTGPLIAPSANPEGEEPAKDINDAKKYFGDKVDFYLDEGELKNNPSKIISLINDKPDQLR